LFRDNALNLAHELNVGLSLRASSRNLTSISPRYKIRGRHDRRSEYRAFTIQSRMPVDYKSLLQQWRWTSTPIGTPGSLTIGYYGSKRHPLAGFEDIKPASCRLRTECHNRNPMHKAGTGSPNNVAIRRRSQHHAGESAGPSFVPCRLWSRLVLVDLVYFQLSLAADSSSEKVSGNSCVASPYNCLTASPRIQPTAALAALPFPRSAGLFSQQYGPLVARSAACATANLDLRTSVDAFAAGVVGI